MQDKDLTLAVFMDEVFQIAFGAEAVEREFTYQQVVNRLREMSDTAWKYEQLED